MARSANAERQSQWRKDHPLEHRKAVRAYKDRKKAKLAKVALEEWKAYQAQVEEQYKVGRIRNERKMRVKKLAEALGVSVEQWFGRLTGEEAAEWADMRASLIADERRSLAWEAKVRESNRKAYEHTFGKPPEPEPAPDALPAHIPRTPPERQPLILDNGMIVD